jgi:hypothetical protein
MFNATSPVAQLPRPAPKLKAIDQVRQSTIEMNFGIPIPTAEINATNYAGHPEPSPDPYLRSLQPNATFYYPLKIVQSSIRMNITVYTAGIGGVLEGAVNNGQFIQVQTPKTADFTTFEPAPVMQFNINQKIVPSLATFRMRVITAGYNIQGFDVVIATN